MLLEMEHRAEALVAWQHCLTLNPNFHPARREMEKVHGLYHSGVPALTSHRGIPLPSEGLETSWSCCSGQQ